MIFWAFMLLTLPSLNCNGANILAFLPFPGLSHHGMFRPILRELASRGHNVTMVTMIPDDKANYNQIIIDNPLLKEGGGTDFWTFRGLNWLNYFYRAPQFMLPLLNSTLNSFQVQQIIHSNDLKFDLILLQLTFFQEAYVALAHKFGAPVVEIQTLSSSLWLNYLLSNPSPLAYHTDFIFPATNNMNFWERLENTLFYVYGISYYQYSLLPKHQLLADEYIRYPGWETRPPLIELLSNISLGIINSNIAVLYPYPNNPNLINVGGLQIQPPKSLPQDLQMYMDSASEGIIYFSLGSNLKSSTMPEATRNIIISALAKLPYKILWKWEAESIPNQPSNVKISKWFPQTDVLAHKNIKAFITHGGLNSLLEAVYHGVPLVVLPVFGDQSKNALQVEKTGYGLILDFDNITETSVIWAVNEVTKPPYLAVAKKQSAIMRENPTPPLETAIYWIEYVIRHKGAEHLRTAAGKLSWYQYFLIDVITLLIVAIVFVCLLIYMFVTNVFRILSRDKTGVKTLKKEN